ncbi:DUF3667 domain-containing protein [Seonamhaeicola sp.]|uniref:DUF3667 domain-containing protein n=1 Tax=Seonamhaeicola sp. TaxID=1912245 RepID=UPI00261DFA90|nr:DUF3667 domain-containing protein [Seonamhaeicola sp.]
MPCKNCRTILADGSDYCHNCGAKVIRNRLTVKNLFEHFTVTFLNYDNKFLQTFLALFRKPEDVIDTYINGTRKKYVNVISYFAIALTFTGLYLFVIKKFFPESIDYSFTIPGQDEAQREIQSELQKKNVSFVQEYMSLFTMLYVPLYALMARVSFIGIKKFNYTELLVVFLYLQAQMSIVTAVAGVLCAFLSFSQGTMSIIFIPLMILYCAYTLKRLYQLNFSGMLLRTILFLAVLGVAFIIISIIMGVIMYFDGTFDKMIEAKRAASGS